MNHQKAALINTLEESIQAKKPNTPKKGTESINLKESNKPTDTQNPKQSPGSLPTGNTN